MGTAGTVEVPTIWNTGLHASGLPLVGDCCRIGVLHSRPTDGCFIAHWTKYGNNAIGSRGCPRALRKPLFAGIVGNRAESCSLLEWSSMLVKPSSLRRSSNDRRPGVSDAHYSSMLDRTHRRMNRHPSRYSPRGERAHPPRGTNTF